MWGASLVTGVKSGLYISVYEMDRNMLRFRATALTPTHSKVRTRWAICIVQAVNVVEVRKRDWQTAATAAAILIDARRTDA